MRARILGLALLLQNGATMALAQPPSAIQATENEVKAAFLYHFAQLVTWPEGAEVDPSSPIVIAVVGAEAFGERLQATIGDQTAKGRPIKIVRVATLGDLAATPQIVFLGNSERGEMDRTLSGVGKSPVLTVSANTGFARRGGMIEFRLTPDHRVTFDINVRAANAVGLKMSSQLLKIARIVESDR